VLRLTAAFLVSADFLIIWLPLDVPGFRSVLARGWHDQLGRTIEGPRGMTALFPCVRMSGIRQLVEES
jgi:hypothetical protein